VYSNVFGRVKNPPLPDYPILYVGEGFQPSRFLYTEIKRDGQMDLPKRRSPRIPNYDYSLPNYYFITICTHEKKCIFGFPGEQTRIGKIVEKHIRKIPEYYDTVSVDKYVVMPNHIHMILVLKGDESNPNVPLIIAQFKRGVTKEIHSMEPNMAVWQRSFHDHIIRNQTGYEKIWTYIENNPQKWEEDCFYCR